MTTSIYDLTRTGHFFNEAIPRVETATAGFSTESYDSIAKRLIKSIDENHEEYIPALAEVIRVRLLNTPKDLDAKIDVVMYSALSDAFEKVFEKAVYNGNLRQHQGKDLLMIEAARIKAREVALDLTQRIFKNKRVALLYKIIDEVQKTDFETPLNRSFYKPALSGWIHKDLVKLRERIFRENEALFIDKPSCGLTEHSWSAEAKSEPLAGDLIDKWDDKIRLFDELKNSFSHILEMGSSSHRSEENYQIWPSSWESYLRRALEAADSVLLKQTTKLSLEAFFEMARLSKPQTFDHLLDLLDRIHKNEFSQASEYYHTVLTSDQKIQIKQLLNRLQASLVLMPEIGVNEEEISRLYLERDRLMASSGSKNKQNLKVAQINKELAPYIYEASLSVVRSTIEKALAAIENLEDVEKQRSLKPDKPPKNRQGINGDLASVKGPVKPARINKKVELLDENSSIAGNESLEELREEPLSQKPPEKPPKTKKSS